MCLHYLFYTSLKEIPDWTIFFLHDWWILTSYARSKTNQKTLNIISFPPSPGHKNKLDASQKTHSEKFAVVVHFILNEGHKKETRSLFIKNNCSPCFKRLLFFLQKLKQTINGYTNFNCLTNVNAFFHHIQIQVYFKPHVS